MVKLHLLIFAVILATQSVSSFEWWNDLRVTWGPLSTINFDRLPRNTIDATKEGWTASSSDCNNGGKFAGIRYVYPANMGAAVLFDSNGNVVGVQALFPQSTAIVSGSTYDFSKVPMIQNETILNIDYFVLTAYFIAPDTICNTTGSGSNSNSSNIGAHSQVYFQNGPDIKELKIAPKRVADGINSGWTKHQCIPGMGWHGYFDTKSFDPTNCSEFQPTCILYDAYDNMHGFCFFMGGNATSSRFEHPDGYGNTASFGADVVPTCIIEQTALIGSTSIHFYFTNTPWNYSCQ